MWFKPQWVQTWVPQKNVYTLAMDYYSAWERWESCHIKNMDKPWGKCSLWSKSVTNGMFVTFVVAVTKHLTEII
jgi:hypothetical protein